MSYALQALVLIQLEAHRGDWIAVDAIAKPLGLSAPTTADCLEQMDNGGEWPGLELYREMRTEPRPLDRPDRCITTVMAARMVARLEA
jgi:hypothetical protein